MLVNFNVFNDLNDPDTTVRLGACTTDSDGSSSSRRAASSHSSTISIHNETTTAKSTTSSWIVAGTVVVELKALSVGSNGAGLEYDVVSAVRAVQQQLTTRDSDPEGTFLVAYSNGAAVGIYAGGRVRTSSAEYVLQKLIDLYGNGTSAETVVMQVCEDGRNSRGTFGVIAYSNPDDVDLGTVQSALAEWSNATCVSIDGASDLNELITLYQTSLSTSTSAVKIRGHPTELVTRATSTGDCTTVQVVR